MAAANDISDQRYARVSDIQKEPQKMLMPIRGYEKLPLVSLEEAVKPLVSILPDIQDYVYIAKKRCEPTPPDGLTLDESASIILYTMEWEPNEECLYFALNRYLRAEDRGELKPWFLYLKLILAALSKLPSTRLSVYRGVKLDLSELYPVGKTFVWWGFSSCTSNMGVLENERFLGRTGLRTLFIIDSESGKDISSHSYYQSEKEILLIAARQLEVEAHLQPADNLHIIQLRETHCPISLIQMGPSEPKSTQSSPDSQAKTILDTSVTPISHKSVIETPVVEEPRVEKPITKRGAAKKSVVEKPVVEGSVIQTPVTKKAIAKNAVIEKPAVEEPVIKTSTVENPVSQSPVTKKAVVHKSVIEKSAVEEPVSSDTIPHVKPKIREFALPGVFKELRCEGRLCAKCGNCRDWYYTGDMESWNWIRNREHWTTTDWEHYHKEEFYRNLKRRDGATCYTLIHRFTTILGGFSAKFVHHHLCLCEDNIRN